MVPWKTLCPSFLGVEEDVKCLHALMGECSGGGGHLLRGREWGWRWSSIKALEREIPRASRSVNLASTCWEGGTLHRQKLPTQDPFGPRPVYLSIWLLLFIFYDKSVKVSSVFLSSVSHSSKFWNLKKGWSPRNLVDQPQVQVPQGLRLAWGSLVG